MQILFLSDHDLVRGPMARALCQKHATEMRVYGASFDSAGISVAQPHHPKPAVIEFMRDQQLNIARHTSKGLSAPQARTADVIFCMTTAIATLARQKVGAQYAGKIVVLNDAIGFGSTANDIEVLSPKTLTHGALLSVFSRLKASTGRLVRMMGESSADASDFGVTASVAPDKLINDPQVRQFITRYMLEFIERAFEHPTSEQIRESLELLGRPLSILDIEELLTHDLGQQVQRAGGRWQIREKPRASKESARAKEKKEPKTESKPPVDEFKGKLTVQEAYKVLQITSSTPRDEAQKIYRKMLMRYHPDKFHDDDEFRVMAEQKARRINMAWEMVREKLPG